MTDAFALVTYKSSKASKIIAQLLLTFTLDFEDLLCRYKLKNFYELWTMAAAQAAENQEDCDFWPDADDEGCIHQFQPETTHKIY